MKFLIIGAASSPNTSDLEIEIKKTGNEVSKVKPSEFIFKVLEREFKIFVNDKDLSDFDIFIFRGYDKNYTEARIFAQKMLSLGKVVVDEAVSRIFMENKLFEASKLSGAGIKYPKSHYIVKYNFFEKIKNNITYPAIVKPIDGKKGADIYKFKKPEELDYFLQKNTKGWLIQECLEIDGDVRVFVVGDKVLGAMKRFIIEGDYRSNISLGAKAEVFELNKEIEDLALNATKAMNYEIAGVDLAYSDGQWYVIEVNTTPQWQGFKKTTGINPAEFIIKYSIDKFKKIS